MEELKRFKEYYIMCALMLLFVANDLIFDFLFNFDSSDAISFGFTLGASIIVFVYTSKLNKEKMSGEFERISAFIKSNFDKWQVVFSILDIFCGIVSLLSGLAFVTCIFKAVKIIYIPVKVMVVTNKGKSLIKSVVKVSLIWTMGRSFIKGDNYTMKKIITNIKNNPRTIIFGFLSSIIFGFAANSAVNCINLQLSFIFRMAIIAVAAVVAFLICILLGWDNVKQAVLYAASQTLDDEKYDQVVAVANALVTKQEAENEVAKQAKIAEKQAKADRAKALKLLEEQKAKDAIAQKEEAEKARLLALAQQIQAEEEAKKAVENNSNPTA